MGTAAHSLGRNWLGTTDIAVQSVLLAIVFVAIGLRLWSRRLQRISLQWNDWLIVGAMVKLSFLESIPAVLTYMPGGYDWSL